MLILLYLLIDMVGPYQLGLPTRSYVRVCGTGSDEASTSLCCDLSRVSTLAAAAPIPSTHVREYSTPLAQNQTTSISNHEEKQKKQCEKATSNTRKRSAQTEVDADADASSVMPPKRNASVSDKTVSRSLFCVKCSSSVRTSVNKMVIENNRLKKKNELLQYRLNAIKNIFHNKNSLAKLLKALQDEQAQPT